MKLGEVLKFFSTNTLSWDQLEYTKEGIINIHYGLIHKLLPTLTDVTIACLPKVRNEMDVKNSELCQDGDVLIADASEDTDSIGKSIELIGCNNRTIVAGLHTLHGRSQEVFAIGFKGYLLASPDVKKQLQKIAQGVKVYSINPRLISPITLRYPSLPEQQKIAALLSLIDERIEVQNAIIKEQEVAKTSLIRRLFDRTLRFPEFTDEWKEVKLGEICPSIQSGKDKKEEGEIPLYGAAKQLAYTRSASYSPPLILIGRVGSVGQLQWIDIPCGVSDNALVIQKGEGEAETADIRFLFYCLKMAHLEQYAGGSSQKVITASFLKSLPLHLPLLPEQRKIADLLSAVDERITVEKEYATLLQKQKAYLLRQMFV